MHLEDAFIHFIRLEGALCAVCVVFCFSRITEATSVV